jgi:hypothetical protein
VLIQAVTGAMYKAHIRTPGVNFNCILFANLFTDFIAISKKYFFPFFFEVAIGLV